MRTWLIAGIAGAALIGGALGVGAVITMNRAPVSQGYAVAGIGGPFALVDQTGTPRTNEDFAGAPMLIYFGYSFCPDVCPTELAKMARAVDLLGEDGASVQPVFITIDPERDTPENIGGYVSLFHPRLTGLTGDEKAVADAAHAYKVFYAKVESEEYADYLMDHSSYFYLMGADGENAGVYPMSFTAEDIADAVRTYLSNSGAIG